MFTALRIAAATVPGIAMIAAHYLPWRKAIGRQLHRLEAYAIGTAAIVGTAVGLLEIADREEVDIEPRSAAEIVILSAASAGVATLTAWTLDASIEQRHRRLDEESRRHAKNRGKC